MKRASIMLACLLLFPAAPAGADPPKGLTCYYDGLTQSFVATWDPVLDATKYSIEVTAGYGVDVDPEVDVVADFHYSTVAPGLTIPFLDLVLSVDLTGDGFPETFAPGTVSLKVKSLNPGPGSGRQKNLFSAICTVY